MCFGFVFFWESDEKCSKNSNRSKHLEYSELLKSSTHRAELYLQCSAPPPRQIKFVLSVHGFHNNAEHRQQEQEPWGAQTSK